MARRVSRVVKTCCCGNTFESLPVRNRQYCSRRCSATANYHNLGAFAPPPSYATCEKCGEAFQLQARSTRGRFCSQRCWGDWLAENIVGDAHPRKGKKLGPQKNKVPYPVKQCAKCPRFFSVKPSHFERALYCGRRCAGIAVAERYAVARAVKADPRVLVKCSVCPRYTLRLPSEETSPVYCTKKCWGEHMSRVRSGDGHPNWKGGRATFYGKSWLWAARCARKRDKVCQECGQTREKNGRNLSVHHIIPFKSFGVERHREANALSNLVTLCNPCHMRQEWAEGAVATSPNPRNKGQKRAKKAS